MSEIRRNFNDMKEVRKWFITFAKEEAEKLLRHGVTITCVYDIVLNECIDDKVYSYFDGLREDIIREINDLYYSFRLK